jgi:hypothetical protein
MATGQVNGHFHAAHMRLALPIAGAQQTLRARQAKS